MKKNSIKILGLLIVFLTCLSLSGQSKRLKEKIGTEVKSKFNEVLALQKTRKGQYLMVTKKYLGGVSATSSNSQKQNNARINIVKLDRNLNKVEEFRDYLERHKKRVQYESFIEFENESYLIYSFTNMLKKKKLVKYEQIQEGDKIKFIVLKEPNPLREKVISFPTYLPPEFDLHKYINYDEQFDKSFLEPLRFIVNAINWNFEKQSTLDNFF